MSINVASIPEINDGRRRYRILSLSVFLSALPFLVACLDRSLKKIGALLIESRGPTVVHESMRYHNTAVVFFGITVVLLVCSLVLAFLGRTGSVRSVWWAPLALLLLFAFSFIENILLF